jgi:dTDP-glucose 4,6-dehydratase
MKLLISGGAGFIGSNFVRKFIDGHLKGIDKLTVVDKLTYAGNLNNFPKNFKEKIEFIHADICDFEFMSRLTKNQDAIVNFAAESHVDRSISDPSVFVRTNVLGTQSLLEAAMRNDVKTFLQISTDEVYGSIDDDSWDEECGLSANSPYSASKASADILALSYFKTYGYDVRVTRCSNNFGPQQHIEKFIPLCITNFIQGKPIPIYGDGGNIRDWIHVDDHCNAIYKVLLHGKPGDVFNVGAGNEVTNVELVKTIGQLMGKRETDLNLKFIKDRRGHDFRYSVNFDRIAGELSYSPMVDFRSGLLKTISWYESNQNWWKTFP